MHKISERVSQEKTYYVSSRERVIEIFLETLANKPNMECYIVYPLFRNYDALLDGRSHLDIQNHIESNMRLAKQGLKIIRIFVLDDEYEVSEYFKEIGLKMLESGIDIYIVHKKEIENMVTSYDFIYTKQLQVAGYRNMEERKCYFKISKDPDKLKNIESDFYKIRGKSIELKNFLEKPYFHQDKALHNLIGEWHFYFYGSMIDNGKPKIWDVLVLIKANKEVIHIDKTNNKVLITGVLDTSFNDRQTYIKGRGNESGNLSLMIIDNQESYKSVFKVSYMDKEHGRQNNMAMFGVFSKVALQHNEIIEVLGIDVKNTQLIESRDFEFKVNELNMRVQVRGEKS